MTIAASEIRNAVETLNGQVVRTPIVRSGGLNDALAADIFLKLVTLQRTRSFKDRGAFVKLKQVAQEKITGSLKFRRGARRKASPTTRNAWESQRPSLRRKARPLRRSPEPKGPMHALFSKAIPSAMPNPMPTKSRTKKGSFLYIHTRIRTSSADKKPSHWKRWLMYQV